MVIKEASALQKLKHIDWFGIMGIFAFVTTLLLFLQWGPDDRYTEHGKGMPDTDYCYVQLELTTRNCYSNWDWVGFTYSHCCGKLVCKRSGTLGLFVEPIHRRLTSARVSRSFLLPYSIASLLVFTLSHWFPILRVCSYILLICICATC